VHNIVRPAPLVCGAICGKSFAGLDFCFKEMQIPRFARDDNNAGRRDEKDT
jgi:hypothetical protein